MKDKGAQSQISSGAVQLLIAMRKGAANEKVVRARHEVLEVAGVQLLEIADLLHVAGFVQREPHQLAAAFLCRVLGELSSSISILISTKAFYAAGALLRQIVEVEYLFFIGYQNPVTLAEWYQVSPEELRKKFTSQKMRSASLGLFRDQEYWHHCEVGGHPHPKGRLLFSAYQSSAPGEYLLPDCVQHVRRTCTSLKLQLPRLTEELKAISSMDLITATIHRWTSLEAPAILAHDGINLDRVDSTVRDAISQSAKNETAVVKQEVNE